MPVTTRAPSTPCGRLPTLAGSRSRSTTTYCPANGDGWCNCVAWHVPTWEGWGERTAAQNRAVRDELFAQGEFDGYLLYVDGVPAGWAQCGMRDRLPKLVRQLGLEPKPEAHALTCFLVTPAFRGKGHAHAFLRGILADLATRGACHVEAYPRFGASLAAGEAWTGPESLYKKAGFVLEKEHGNRRVYSFTVRGPGVAP